MEELKKILETVKPYFGIEGEVFSGRSAEINERVGRLMGREVETETPKEYYERCAALAKPQNRD